MTHYCFITAGSWSRNASTVRLRELGSELARRGVRVTYVVDDRPEHRNGALRLNPDAHVAYVAPCAGVGQFSARRRTLLDLRPDVIHILDPLPKLFAAAVATSTAVVGDWDEWPAQRGWSVRHPVDLALDPWLRRRARLTVVASRYLQKQFRDRYGVNAVYLPYAVSSEQHLDGPSPYKEPTAVYLGNLYPAFDHDLLFGAARLLRERGLRPRLDVIGGGPDLDNWRRVLAQEQLDNVHLVGYATGEELWRRLRHAHALLLPIRPTVLNKARCPSKIFAYLKARRPIIANRVGEVNNVLGDLPCYVEPTPEAFADALERSTASERLPDVDYDLDAHSWARRADTLITSLEQANLWNSTTRWDQGVLVA